MQILIRVNPDKYCEQRVWEILSDSRQVLLGYWKDQQKSSNRLIFVLILALIQAFNLCCHNSLLEMCSASPNERETAKCMEFT